MHEVKHAQGSCFVTLTYDDVHLPKNGSLVIRDCQLFIKRLRKNLKKRVRYFLGAEYGELGKRPHYHVILFGATKEDRKAIDLSWGNGFVHIGDVTYDSACYVAGYTIKKLSGPRFDEYKTRGVIPEFGLMSRRPGIGFSYVDSNKDFVKLNGFCVVKGNKVAVPRFYSNKIFISDEDKKILHEKRQKIIDEGFELSMRKSRLGFGYQVNDYQRTEREQAERDLKARQLLKRRVL